MKKIKQSIFFFLFLLVPALFVFRSFFSSSHLVWGDAPYFYPEGLVELSKGVFAWTNRGNNFGGINSFLWLSPIMLVYGWLHSLLGLSNDLIIRILFYFPSLILSFIGPILLVRHFKFSRAVQFFTALFYVFNTYYLLLVDGGVVGLALAYGLFPLTLLFLHQLFDQPSIKNFSLALLFSFFLTVIDPRLAVISFLVMIVWVLIEQIGGSKKNLFLGLRNLLLLIIGLVGLNAYWLMPLLKFGQGSLGVEASGLQLVSWQNSFFLFQPHWPNNIFGQVSNPPLYFAGLLLLVFGSLFAKNKKKKSLIFILLFLAFGFLAKGNGLPLGQVYGWLVNHLPFGFAFRDSTKFFIPLVLFAGILIGMTAEEVDKRIFNLIVYAYLLFLISPALLGKLNFVLSQRENQTDYQRIYQAIKSEDGFFRTAWFPERPPLVFQTEEKPALDAKDLVEGKPFSLINVGTYDRFNFLHNPISLDWLKTLGVKYLIFSGDQRKPNLTDEEEENWEDLLNRVATSSGLVKVDWDVDFPIYQLEARPRIFSFKQLFVVIGGELNQAGNFVYLEDGKFDPSSLLEVNPEAVVLVFNDKTREDLTMSFLQKYFVAPDRAEGADWAVYSQKDYLDWKYQLLIRGVSTKEFDYDQGIAFSTEEKERIEFEFKIKQKSEYFLIIRGLSVEENAPLKISFNNETHFLEQEGTGTFQWYVKSFDLDQGKQKLVLENQKGLSIINLVGLVPIQDWNNAGQKTEELINRFRSLDQAELDERADFDAWSKVDFEKTSPVKYKVVLPESGYWLVFTDSHHPDWQLKGNQTQSQSLPVYSIVNGFYFEPGNGEEVEITFKGQKNLQAGLLLSTVSFLVLAIVFLWSRSKKEEKN